MKKIYSIILIVVLCLLSFVGCNENVKTDVEVANTPTGISGEAPRQQPHDEVSFEDMINFINTVDEETYQDGDFNSIIDRVREEGYIIRPYFDGEPSTLADRGSSGAVYIEPYYVKPNVPPQFMYHFDDDGYKYRINVMYIDEAYIDASDADGYAGYRKYRDGDTTGQWKTTEEYNNITHQIINIDGEDRNVTFETWPDNDITNAFFVWDKYLIKVAGDVYVEGGNAYGTCNVNLLTRLSFEKIPLE